MIHILIFLIISGVISGEFQEINGNIIYPITNEKNSDTCYQVVISNNCLESIFYAFCFDEYYGPIVDGCCGYYIQIAKDCIPQMASDAKAANRCGQEVDLIDGRATKLYQFCLNNL